MRIGLLCLLGLAGCVASGPRISASAGDGDGRVSYREFAAALDSRAFARLDEDRSGTVDGTEWRQLDGGVEAKQDFEALDTDRDHEINPYEWQANKRSGVSGSFRRDLRW